MQYWCKFCATSSNIEEHKLHDDGGREATAKSTVMTSSFIYRRQLRAGRRGADRFLSTSGQHVVLGLRAHQNFKIRDTCVVGFTNAVNHPMKPL